jgi:hypothetical protein
MCSMKLRDLVEARIRDAQARGELDNLPGAGKALPEDGLDALPPEARLEARLLASAGGLPEEVVLLRRIAELERELAGARRARREQVATELVALRTRLSILFEGAGRYVAASRVIA